MSKIAEDYWPWLRVTEVTHWTCWRSVKGCPGLARGGWRAGHLRVGAHPNERTLCRKRVGDGTVVNGGRGQWQGRIDFNGGMQFKE